VIDRDLLSELQYVLIEPPDGGDTWPSLIWTRQEVLDALDGGVQRITRDCHLAVERVELPVSAGTLQFILPADWVATAAMVWRDAATSVRTPLGKVDSFEADLAVPGWEVSPGLPLAYVPLDGTSLITRLCPTPAADGVVELLYVQVPPLILGDGSELPIPEELTSAVKYDALAWLLRKMGRLLDSERADYCDRRYELAETVTQIILGGWA